MLIKVSDWLHTVFNIGDNEILLSHKSRDMCRTYSYKIELLINKLLQMSIFTLQLHFVCFCFCSCQRQFCSRRRPEDERLVTHQGRANGLECHNAQNSREKLAIWKIGNFLKFTLNFQNPNVQNPNYAEIWTFDSSDFGMFGFRTFRT